MSTQFSAYVGYTGSVRLDDVVLLATGGQFSQSHQPIFSTGVWGAGYYNAAENVAYSNNFIRIEGNASFEYSNGDAAKKLEAFAFSRRGSKTGMKIEIYPAERKGFVGYGWCTSLSFNNSQDANMTGDFNFSSYLDGDNNKIITGDISTDDSSSDDASSSATSSYRLGTSGGRLPNEMAYDGLYPYWNNFIFPKKLDGTDGYDTENPLNNVMSWSASYSSSLEMLKCCGPGNAYQNPEKTPTPLSPDYVVLGTMSGECSMEIFTLLEQGMNSFDPKSFHEQKGILITAKTSRNESPINIVIPIIVCNQNSSSVQTGASFVTASFSYTAIGDAAQPPVGMIIEGDDSSFSI